MKKKSPGASLRVCKIDSNSRLKCAPAKQTVERAFTIRPLLLGREEARRAEAAADEKAAAPVDDDEDAEEEEEEAAVLGRCWDKGRLC